jgi:hypothetical protein
MLKIYPLIVLFCLSAKIHSQNFIKGTVIDSTQAAVPFCPMALLSAKDSSQVKGNISDSAGYFSFEKIKPGDYFIKFSAVGFRSAATATFMVDSVSQITLPTQILNTEGVNLKELYGL